MRQYYSTINRRVNRLDIEIRQVLILNGFLLEENMNIPRPESTKRPFVLTGAKGLYYISQSIQPILIQRGP